MDDDATPCHLEGHNQGCLLFCRLQAQAVDGVQAQMYRGWVRAPQKSTIGLSLIFSLPHYRGTPRTPRVRFRTPKLNCEDSRFSRPSLLAPSNSDTIKMGCLHDHTRRRLIPPHHHRCGRPACPFVSAQTNTVPMCGSHDRCAVVLAPPIVALRVVLHGVARTNF